MQGGNVSEVAHSLDNWIIAHEYNFKKLRSCFENNDGLIFGHLNIYGMEVVQYRGLDSPDIFNFRVIFAVSSQNKLEQKVKVVTRPMRSFELKLANSNSNIQLAVRDRVAYYDKTRWIIHHTMWTTTLIVTGKQL